jgi:hypothetical protein
MPTNETIRDQILTQEDQELMVKALGGDANRIPERCIN